MQPGTMCQQPMRLQDTFLAMGDQAAALPERIAAHARRSPARLAVSDESRQLTFAELEAKSSALAAALIAAGATADSCIGLFFERSTDFVVAALAVMKSGAAYLAMDSGTPADRAALMLADAGASLVLTHRQKTRDWACGAWRVMDMHAIGATSDSIECVAPHPHSLAYVVYTSGSTGRPKGVEITHANLLNLIDWHQNAFGVTSHDRASQVAGLGFDATAWEVWPHLAAGASVHFAEELTRRSPQALRDWLVAEQISIAFVPTVLAEQLLHNDWPSATSLRILLTGADVLHRRPVAGLPFVVVNNYGPSECTVVATSGVVAASAELFGPPSIGKPIDNAAVYLLDENLRPVQPGEAGELCIAGDLVGRGYRNQPEMTASRFVEYSPEPGRTVRIYRTGDRARWLANGELAFLGRLDEQLKIRGYRIEPGEIVANLDRYPGVEASAIAAVEGEAGPALVAYVVTSCCTTLTANDLREYLAARLPEYMIPAQFVKLAALPLTANGKLNKKELPPPSLENLLANRAAGPTTNDIDAGLQQQIGALVATLLEQPTVAADDNFFMLGGHSMLAAQLVARVGAEFGVKLSLRQLFMAPTVAALAAEIARLREASHV